MERQLGEMLLDHGVVSTEQLRTAVEEQHRTGESVFKILMAQGVLSERDIVRAHAQLAGLMFVDLHAERPDPHALTTVPPDVARRQLVLPLRVQDDGTLLLAMAEPRNHLAIDEVATASGRQIVAAAAYRADLIAAIDRVYASDHVTVGASDPRTSTPPVPEVAPVAPEMVPAPPVAPEMVPAPPVAPDAPVNGAGHAAGTTFGAEDLPMVEAPVPEPPPDEVVEDDDKDPNLADFLEQVISGGASDLHLTSGLPPMIRVDGELRPIRGYRRLGPRDLQDLLYSILNQKQRETFEENLELDVSYSFPGRARFRVNVFRQRDAMGSVMRLIPFEIRSIDDLGLPPAVKEFAKLRRGLVLVTGITGSGKSTTLAGLIDIINSSRAEHIMTVEDPIEFLHRHKKAIINQREVGTDTHGFAEALRHVLRQDPDVILVGEMRDLETIQTALTAAETGHLVFGTLHTQDAPQSVDRVIDVFPPHQQQQVRVQLAGTLAGIVSQQLLPSIDGKGRTVAAEVLVATPAVRNLIREGKTHQIYTSMQAGGKFGMQVMDQHLAQLVKIGRVGYEVALEHSHHVDEFNRLAGRTAGHG
jgi:twitching motility protein PilT